MSYYCSDGYYNLRDLGSNDPDMANPLTYCAVSTLDSMFSHTNGRFVGPNSEQCQRFMSQYCAKNWDEICEIKSQDYDRGVPNMLSYSQPAPPCPSVCPVGNYLTRGEMLIRNSAAEKYLSTMSSNCRLVEEPFDPINPTSPMVKKWVTQHTVRRCVPVYEVNEATIDADPIMNKILKNPNIALDILINIYQNAAKNNKLDRLKNTKLYAFFMSEDFQKIIKNTDK